MQSVSESYQQEDSVELPEARGWIVRPWVIINAVAIMSFFIFLALPEVAAEGLTACFVAWSFAVDWVSRPVISSTVLQCPSSGAAHWDVG